MASETEQRVKEAFSRLGLQGWWVGGSARDRLLGRELREEDILLEGDLETNAAALARILQGVLVRPDPKNRSLRLILNDRSIDLVPLAATLEEDLSRRDFTVNAMAVDLLTDALHDPLNGRTDLAEKRLRTCSAEAFTNDPIRLLRALRLSLELNFEIEAETKKQLKRDAHLLWGSAPERIAAELCRILAQKDLKAALEQLHDLNLDAALSSSKKDFGDLKKVVLRDERLEHLLSLLAQEIADRLNDVLQREIAKERTLRQTLRLDWLGEAVVLPHRFYQTLSNAERNFISRRPLREQLAHFVLFKSSRWAHSLLKLYREAGEDLPLYLVLASPLEGDERDEERLKKVIAVYRREWRAHLSSPLLRGTDMLAEGFSGREIGEQLTAVEIARLEGKLSRRGEAVSFLRKKRDLP